jgi:hypothetical protein
MSAERAIEEILCVAPLGLLRLCALTQASFALPGRLFSLGYQMTAYSGLCADHGY